MTGLFEVRITRHLPHPVDAAYAWLTDYQDDDAERTGAIVKRRPVVLREKDRVVLDGEIEVLGRRRSGRVEVRLFPPDHWEARFLNPRGGPETVYDYRLTPEDGGSRLKVSYRTPVRKWSRRLLLAFLKPRIRRDLVRMWQGFEASMTNDLAPSASQSDSGGAS